jgi:hypothetical protein
MPCCAVQQHSMAVQCFAVLVHDCTRLCGAGVCLTGLRGAGVRLCTALRCICVAVHGSAVLMSGYTRLCGADV